MFIRYVIPAVPTACRLPSAQQGEGAATEGVCPVLKHNTCLQQRDFNGHCTSLPPSLLPLPSFARPAVTGFPFYGGPLGWAGVNMQWNRIIVNSTASLGEQN